MHKRPTIRHLAQQLGLSKTTVSAALAGDPKVKPETRRRVEQLARETAYRPHPHFRILGAQRRQSSRSSSDTIAFVIRRKHRDLVRRFQAAKNRAEQLGYTGRFL